MARVCWKLLTESTRIAYGIFQASAVSSSTAASVAFVNAVSSSGSITNRILSFVVYVACRFSNAVNSGFSLEKNVR